MKVMKVYGVYSNCIQIEFEWKKFCCKVARFAKRRSPVLNEEARQAVTEKYVDMRPGQRHVKDMKDMCFDSLNLFSLEKQDALPEWGGRPSGRQE